jgi:hypothetical protein
MGQYYITIDMFGRDPMGLRAECEAAADAICLEADSIDDAQRQADEWLTGWIRHNAALATNADGLAAGAVAVASAIQKYTIKPDGTGDFTTPAAAWAGGRRGIIQIKVHGRTP